MAGAAKRNAQAERSRRELQARPLGARIVARALQEQDTRSALVNIKVEAAGRELAWCHYEQETASRQDGAPPQTRPTSLQASRAPPALDRGKLVHTSSQPPAIESIYNVQKVKVKSQLALMESVRDCQGSPDLVPEWQVLRLILEDRGLHLDWMITQSGHDEFLVAVVYLSKLLQNGYALEDHDVDIWLLAYLAFYHPGGSGPYADITMPAFFAHPDNMLKLEIFRAAYEGMRLPRMFTPTSLIDFVTNLDPANERLKEAIRMFDGWWDKVSFGIHRTHGAIDAFASATAKTDAVVKKLLHLLHLLRDMKSFLGTGTSIGSTPGRKPTLLSLPSEIRLMIYDKLFEPLVVRPSFFDVYVPYFDWPLVKTQIVSNLALTCRTLREETKQHFETHYLPKMMLYFDAVPPSGISINVSPTHLPSSSRFRSAFMLGRTNFASIPLTGGPHQAQKASMGAPGGWSDWI